MSLTILRPDVVRTFIINHFPGDKDACWPYLGYIAKEIEYGKIHFTVDHVQYYYLAHRIAYMYYNKIQELNGSIVIRHTCDNSICCNPNHLITGTHGDNRADCIERNRHAKGETVGTAKLTEEQVKEIRYKALLGFRHGTLAREYGVTRPAISYAVKYNTWKHIK